MKKYYLILILISVFSESVAQNNQTNNHLALWYNKPANAKVADDKNDQNWLNALPVGNGFIGAMVYGDVNSELIQLNEKSLWSGKSQDADNLEAHQSLAKIRELLFNGNYNEATQLTEKTQICSGRGSGYGHGSNAPYGSYETLGDLHFNFSNNTPYTDYYRELSLNDAIVKVNYKQAGIKYQREIFVSYPNKVLVVRLSANKKGAISFNCRLSRSQKCNTYCKDNQMIMQGQLFDGESDNGMKYMVRLKAINKGGSIKYADSLLIVEKADEVVLLLSAATDYLLQPPHYKGADFENISLDNLNKASKLSYLQLLQNHLHDYRNLFNRLAFRIKDNDFLDTIPTDRRLDNFKQTKDDKHLVELYFQYGRYLLIASSRDGALPANLQGIWGNKTQLPWNCDYHTDINIQMNYWLVDQTNLSECQMPLTELIESLVPSGTKTAQVHYKAGGWCIHPITNVWGYTSPGEHPSWGLHLGAGAWLCQHLWDHYAFTNDVEYLRRVFPVMRGSAQFYLDWLVADPKTGKLVSGPAGSPENSFKTADGTVAQISMGPSHDQQLIWDLFTNILEAAQVLAINDELIQKVKVAKANLLITGIGSDGRLMEWANEFEEPEPGHRHISHLFALHPGRQITLSQTPDLAAAARKSLEYRLINGGGHTGWSAAWVINFWARLAEGDKALELLDVLLTRSTVNNLFDMHPPFQIDGNFGATSGIAEMLLQSHTGTIDLLPALPTDWRNGKITGICARGAFVVDIEWKNNKLIAATIVSNKGNRCKVSCQGQAIEFATEAGKAYKLNGELQLVR